MLVWMYFCLRAHGCMRIQFLPNPILQPHVLRKQCVVVRLKAQLSHALLCTVQG